ncbi:bifunctional [glutamine synthetase] adenylyltransferase/[glutamine synthetase]-adenylyl-L-tyrosine phosphorylase [Amaricoccus macauensis]|uniref:bifunctional [glutamine synthetase] adenylyltransferase/[glutamine synthetase]-adenylyl-L-tyrosine phosphorylase n=1 Tax=Amaricoccus macauensis TaxID=57001 RepID=UPI003C7AB7D3
MTTAFADLITTAPRPHEPDLAEAARTRFADLPEAARDLVAATSACSGYLRRSAEIEEEWLREAVALPPETAMEQILADIPDPSPDTLGKNLRIAKRRGALLIALADLGGVWPLENVTGALTRLADTAVDTALKTLLAVEIGRGKLPGCTEEDIATGAGLFALAMGKMGAGELNYSSDIDLIMLFDETRFEPDQYGEARQSFVRVTQKMVKLLSQHTGEGYVFRTDLRLRPDPSSTPVVIATETAENYYESLGRTWERAAYIKARPCAGDIAAGRAFLDRLTPFVWRRHLDYAAIEDAYDMLERIRSHKGLAGPIEVPGHNVKLGRGGIREIEFFAQTRQLILGGRNRQLRDRRTLPILAALAKEGWVDGTTATALSAAYRALRTTEHRLQMLEDAQTHRVPASDAGLARCADFCGYESAEAMLDDLKSRFETVHALTEPFFAPDAPPKEAAPSVWEVFKDPEKAEGLISGWRRIPALRTERARAKFRRLEPELLRRIAEAHDADEALRSLDAFLRRLPAGVQLFSMMEANPQLLDLLVDICGTTQALAHYLGSNAGVLDAVISQDFFGGLRGVDALRTELQEVVDRAADYETVLNATRIWMKERHFRIGVHLLRGLSEPEEVAVAYSAVAEAVIDVLLPQVSANFAERHGKAPGSGAAVLAMGKFGSREMTVSSDLDLIMIYDAESGEMSDGRRPLAAPAYYARLTQALISALTAPTPEGILYKVDMRLRPSGRQGPLATSLAAFRTYQAKEAWTWEHLALTRARIVAGPVQLRQRIDEAIRGSISAPHDPEKVVADVKDMRRRLAEAHEKDAANPWTTKKGPGRMMDIELLVQTGALIHGLNGVRRPRRLADRLVRLGWLGKQDGECLTRSLDRLAAFQQVSRLASDKTVNPSERGEGFVRLVLRVTGASDLDTLRDTFVREARRCEEIINRRLDTA